MKNHKLAKLKDLRKTHTPKLQYWCQSNQIHHNWSLEIYLQPKIIRKPWICRSNQRSNGSHIIIYSRKQKWVRIALKGLVGIPLLCFFLGATATDCQKQAQPKDPLLPRRKLCQALLFLNTLPIIIENSMQGNPIAELSLQMNHGFLSLRVTP